MGDLLIRSVGDDVVRQLKSKAEINGTSLQAEAQKALSIGAAFSADERRKVFAELDRLWGDRPRLSTGGAEIVREARDENGW